MEYIKGSCLFFFKLLEIRCNVLFYFVQFLLRWKLIAKPCGQLTQENHCLTTVHNSKQNILSNIIWCLHLDQLPTLAFDGGSATPRNQVD